MTTDAIIEAAFAAPEAQPIADAQVPNTTSEENIHEPEAEPTEPVDGAKDEPFSKKAVNALSRRDKQIGKLKAEREYLQTQLNELRTQSPQPQNARPGLYPNRPNPNGEPKEADYQNYHDYIRAVNKWDATQLLAERDDKLAQTQQSSQEQAWVSQRESHVAQQAQTFIKENPEALAIIEEYGETIDEFSPQLQRLFLEADNAPLAVFNLAKEGKLESLSGMSLAKAAMEIGRAQTQAPAKPQTKAPTPLPASRGSVASGKSLDRMSGTELLNWVNAKD